MLVSAYLISESVMCVIDTLESGSETWMQEQKTNIPECRMREVQSLFCENVHNMETEATLASGLFSVLLFRNQECVMEALLTKTCFGH